MESAVLYRNQAFLCNVSVNQSARGVELHMTPPQSDIQPGSSDTYQLRHRGRLHRVDIVENFSFGPETRLRIEIGVQER